MATLKDIMFGLDIAVEVLEAIKGDADAFECPEDITGAVKTVCALSKNIASIVLSVIVSTIRLVSETNEPLAYSSTHSQQIDSQNLK